ncbi:MAG: fibrillarin-like rRNA/tRNA 2'-O-methyltransferase [Candidatus Aenigmarchaeota archaeon]|nr:fibrillarin-like rRNA/tRNA 2'-O-methyltransferase [Candidatus Aenigmarchaeota archaeon]
MEIKEKFPGIFLIDGKLAVKNQISGWRPFGEQLIKVGSTEYRFWDPNRSKLAAAIMKGLKVVPIKEGDKILYLGIAHGFTASFISSIIGKNGIIYGVEFAPRVFNELLPVTEKAKNIVPILGDARKPETYSWVETCDVVYVDIAQPDLTEVAIRNCKAFLKRGGYLLLAIKTQSIDVTAPAKRIIDCEVEKLRAEGFEILDVRSLEPFEERHGFVVARM